MIARTIAELEPDFSKSDRDMDDLIRLASAHRFDFFEFLRLISEAGAPTLSCEVDQIAAVRTGRRIVRYKLGEGLQVILTALRARNLNTDKVECGSAVGNSLPISTGRPCRFPHDLNLTPPAEDRK